MTGDGRNEGAERLRGEIAGFVDDQLAAARRQSVPSLMLLRSSDGVLVDEIESAVRRHVSEQHRAALVISAATCSREEDAWAAIADAIHVLQRTGVRITSRIRLALEGVWAELMGRNSLAEDLAAAAGAGERVEIISRVLGDSRSPRPDVLVFRDAQQADDGARRLAIETVAYVCKRMRVQGVIVSEERTGSDARPIGILLAQRVRTQQEPRPSKEAVRQWIKGALANLPTLQTMDDRWIATIAWLANRRLDTLTQTIDTLASTLETARTRAPGGAMDVTTDRRAWFVALLSICFPEFFAFVEQEALQPEEMLLRFQSSSLFPDEQESAAEDMEASYLRDARLRRFFERALTEPDARLTTAEDAARYLAAFGTVRGSSITNDRDGPDGERTFAWMAWVRRHVPRFAKVAENPYPPRSDDCEFVDSALVGERLREARLLQRQGLYAKASPILEAALRLARGTGLLENQFECSIEAATNERLWASVGQLAERRDHALRHLAAAEAIAERRKDDTGRVRVLILTGAVHNDRNDTAKAIDAWRQAVAVSRFERCDPELAVAAAEALGRGLMTAHDQREAKEVFESAATYAKTKDLVGAAERLNALAASALPLVFVCYVHEDAEIVDLVVQHFREVKAPWRVFLDYQTIEAGRFWLTEIDWALSEASLYLCLVSDAFFDPQSFPLAYEVRRMAVLGRRMQWVMVGSTTKYKGHSLFSTTQALFVGSGGAITSLEEARAVGNAALTSRLNDLATTIETALAPGIVTQGPAAPAQSDPAGGADTAPR